MIHFVFDSYIPLAIKDSESLKRGLHITYELVDIYPCTALPLMMGSFWESDSNKRKVIKFTYEYYLEHPMKSDLTIVSSGYLIPKEDTWENSPGILCQNVLVPLRFSYHHFNSRQKQTGR